MSLSIVFYVIYLPAWLTEKHLVSPQQKCQFIFRLNTFIGAILVLMMAALIWRFVPEREN